MSYLHLDIPLLGTVVLCLVLISATYTMGVGVLAGRGRPHLLPAARLGTLATCAFVALGVLILAYAFQTHDFRIRYVGRYSDRSMPWWYLFTSLWGGQDGSLLWWSFLLTGYTAAFTLSVRRRVPELQPWIYVTLMSILAFFVIVMLFAANPFERVMSALPPVDGEGLNPLLQNYWMVIHPPSLYMGFVGWSVPFAFVVAALASGRMTNEWVIAQRRWAMIAWTFLSLGNLLGALWSYEELGWGGYWAWDPVENASFMPWLVGTAFIHSVMGQERFGLLRLWNVFLLFLTFFMTIFGTFLTRSGLIASVHSFARSDIGVYFVWYMVLIVVVCAALVVWRWKQLRSDNALQSTMSREFALLVNNWILLAMAAFVAFTTTWPLWSELFFNQEVTVGPGFYNKWMVPAALSLLLLMAVGPLLAWRKTSEKHMWMQLRGPLAVAAVAMVLHFTVGPMIGFPPIVASTEIYPTWTGKLLAYIFAASPAVAVPSIVFVVGTIVQEFVRGARARMSSKKENFVTALVRLTFRARRRYGGYIVHLGVALLCFGIVGAAYDFERESSLKVGQGINIANYELRYRGSRTEADASKTMQYADLDIFRGDKLVGTSSPAKFRYRTHPEMPTTEVDIRRSLREDIYVIMASVNPATKSAVIRVIERPLVSWIWIGGLIALLGSLFAFLPSAKEVLAADEAEDEQGPSRRTVWSWVTASFLFLVLMSLPFTARAQSGSSSAHAGTVEIHDPVERQMFEGLLCMCGGCERLPLSTCGCEWAEDMRAEVRDQRAEGASPEKIRADYKERFGQKALSIPDDKGFDRALWAAPVAAIGVAALLVAWLGRKWSRKSIVAKTSAPPGPTSEPSETDPYDARLEEELRKGEDD